MITILYLASLFLFAFIPLFPKLPLFDAIPGYIVRVRPEDVLVFFTGVIWILSVYKKRVTLKTPYIKLASLYAIAGVVSLFVGIFFLRTIPLGVVHIGKSSLHLFRYLEYFSLFFFFFTSIRKKWHVRLALVVLVLTLVGVIGYGVGQKYAHFPVYSTMNREYSKGELLYLEQGARLQSTFAGHYDLAAYLVIVLPLIFSLALGNLSPPRRWRRLLTSALLLLVTMAGVGILVISGSKISIVGFAVGLLFTLFLYWRRISSRRIKIASVFVFLLLIAIGMPVVWFSAPASLRTKIMSKLPFRNADAKNRPADLVGDGYEDKVISVANPDGTSRYEKVRVASTYSANALKYGLSMGIRLDTLWPQALLGFARSPLTGSGYGTLAMLDSGLFQEADSTDNNYLRVIGETGIFGFVTFFGFVFVIFMHLFSLANKKDMMTRSLATGLAGSIIGLLITAIYLDIFAASKVAFTFWAVTGLVLKASELAGNGSISLAPLWKHIRSHARVYIAFIFGFLLLYQNPFLRQSVTKDVEAYTSGMEEITRAHCFLKSGTFNLCRDSGSATISSPTPYSLLLMPLLGLFKIPGVFAYLNFLIIMSLCMGVFVFLRRRKVGEDTIFYVLCVMFSTFALLRLTWMPLSTLPMLILVMGVVVFVLPLAHFFQSSEWQVRRGVLFLGIFVFLVSRPNVRFRNLSPNDAFTTIQIANGTIHPNAQSPAYLVSAQNPYFADWYALHTYSLLPLSQVQPYGKQLTKVWGVSDAPSLSSLYDSLLEKEASLFVTDYNTQKGSVYTGDFKSLKEKYFLQYLALGCDDRCNIFSLEKARPIVTPSFFAPLNGRVFEPQKLPSSYELSLVSYRFDKVTTQTLINELTPHAGKPYDFMIITGDFIHSPEPMFVTLFANSFASKVKYPILYSAGNMDLIQHKYYDGGHAFFFTATDFYILLDTDKDSRFGTAEQLAFYNDLLWLEKLSNIKNVFVVSHDLNWQNAKDPQNALHIIERKMKAFPNVHTYVITANHAGEGYVREDSKEKAMTYVASLSRGDVRDEMLHIRITDGTVSINPEKLLP